MIQQLSQVFPDSTYLSALKADLGSIANGQLGVSGPVKSMTTAIQHLAGYRRVQAPNVCMVPHYFEDTTPNRAYIKLRYGYLPLFVESADIYFLAATQYNITNVEYDIYYNSAHSELRQIIPTTSYDLEGATWNKWELFPFGQNNDTFEPTDDLSLYFTQSDSSGGLKVFAAYVVLHSKAYIDI